MVSGSDERRAALCHRIQSLTGMLPVGIFLALHVLINVRAVRGEIAYGKVAERAARGGFPGLLWTVFVVLPLIVHIGLGLAVRFGWVASPRPSEHRRPADEKASRLAALGASVFVAYHLVSLWLPLRLGRLAPSDLHSALIDRLSSTTGFGIPLHASLYVVGLAAATYHFAVSAPRAAEELGMIRGARAYRLLSFGGSVAAIALFLVGAGTVVYLATGQNLLPFR